MKRTLFIALLLNFVLLGSLFAQERTVTGTVTSKDDGIGIPGVNVVVKGTTVGTITDFDGKFKIAVPEGKTTMVFSFVGMKTQDVEITGDVVNVVMETDALGLEEVVVVGYGVQKKSDVTSAITSVKSEEIERLPVLGVDQALQGKAAGVKVTTNSGSPGAGVTVRIRGVGTVNDPDPLYVVDGFPVDDIKFLNPQDISSMEILKDASASAIYGSRGANGVVLITTKQGKVGKATVSVDAYYGVQSVWNEPDLLNSQEYVDIMREAYVNAGKKPEQFKLQEPADDINHTTDWFGEMTRVAPQQNYNIAINGGSKTSRYSVSANYFNQEGTIEKSDYERITFRLNSDHDINQRLKVGNNLTMSHSTKHGVAEGDYFNGTVNAALKLDPLTPVQDADGNWVSSPYTDVKNPVAQLDFENEEIKRLRTVGNIWAEVKIVDGLTFKSNFGMELGQKDTYDFNPTFYLANDEQNQISKLIRGNSKWDSWLWENTLTYTKEIGMHNFTVMGGMSAQNRHDEWYTATKDSLVSEAEDLWYFDAATGTVTATGKSSDWAMLSYLARVNYNYADRYLLTASVRRDGCSRFGEDNRWGTFPSFSFGWNIMNESFGEAIPYASRLKLRVGWGQTGNSNIGNYPWASTIDVDPYFTYVFSGPGGETKVPGAAPRKFGNSEIMWETVESTNFGVDFGLLGNRITGSVDYFVKKTKDMILDVPVPDYTGYTDNPETNAGSVENKGLELVLTHRKMEGDFTYDVSFNISTAKNEITSLGDGDPISSAYMRIGNASRTEVGHEIAGFYGYVTDGLFQNEADLDAHSFTNADGETERIQPKAIPGDFRFKDIGSFDEEGNKTNIPDGKIDDADRDYIGSPYPDFTYGLTFNCAYKGIDFSIFFEGTKGNDIFNFMDFYTMSGGDVWNKDRRILDRWQGEGTSNEVPILNYSDKNDNLRISDRYIEDGSYLRLKNLQIGYTLPSSITEKAGIRKCRLYVGGQNLMTFTDYSGLDPEVGQRYTTSALTVGVDLGTYPQARILTVGANITF